MMKRKITIILTAVIVLTCFSGCMVKKSGASATGEASSEVSPEITREVTVEQTKEKEIGILPIKETTDKTEKFKEPTDEYPLEYLDNSYLTPLNPGIIKWKYWEINIIPQADSFLSNYEERSLGLFDSYNIVLAKIEDIKEVKIHDRYYIKYKYNIQKVYNGNIKKGETVDVIKRDWSKEQTGPGEDKFGYKEFYKEQLQYPQKGQYVITSIYREDFTGPFASKEWCEDLYKEEYNLIKNCYIDSSSSQSMIVMDKDFKVLAVGETGINISHMKSCKNLEEAETLIDFILKEIDGKFFSLEKYITTTE